MIFSRWNVFLCLLLIFLSFVSSSSLFGGCGGGEIRGVTFNNLNDSPIVCFVLNVRSSRFVAQGHWSYLHPIQWKSNRREWRMGFIRIRQAVNRRIKGEKKKKTPADIHEDNSPASVLFLFFLCEALIVRKCAAVNGSSFLRAPNMWGCGERVGQEIRQARWQTYLAFYLQDKHPFGIISFFLIQLKKIWEKKKKTQNTGANKFPSLTLSSWSVICHVVG